MKRSEPRVAKRLNQYNLPELEEYRQRLQVQLDAVEAGTEHFESPEWLWLTKVLLPTRQRELEHEKAESWTSPINMDQQWLIQGQIAEIKKLTETLPGLQDTLSDLRKQLLTVSEAIRKVES